MCLIILDEFISIHVGRNAGKKALVKRVFHTFGKSFVYSLNFYCSLIYGILANDDLKLHKRVKFLRKYSTFKKLFMKKLNSPVVLELGICRSEDQI